MKTRNQIILSLTIVLVAVGVVAFTGLRSGGQEAAGGGMEGHDHSAMSAGVEQAQPVTLSPDAANRIGVTYATVRRGTLDREVRTLGFVAFDETRLTTVSPKIDGWVERLYVDFTGAPVDAGQPLLEVYSPALVTAQEELILARNLLAETRAEGGTRSTENATQLLAAARRRLAYWDIPQDEIRAIEEGGTVSKTLTLRAPAGGIVVKKSVVEGARITPGMNLYELADLIRVWIDADVFEKDLSLVRTGQHAMVTFEAYPGETFHGSITYVYPTVSSTTRTGKVRLELPNPGLKLKPGMYAEVKLQSPAVSETLLIPRSALLQTGERSIVFHRMPNGQLHPMEVVAGLSSEDQVQVLSGLKDGDVVVASATFLIDAESNLGAAMAGMAGMDHSGMDMGDADMDRSGSDSMQGVDHSQHQMPGPSADTGSVEVDHTQMDHSGHTMPGMAGDSSAVPDTAGSGRDHGGMDHSGHVMPGMVPDSALAPDTTGAGRS
jgi:RND family efflux transporter MFP subunit